MLGTKNTNYLNQESRAWLRFQDSLQKVSQAMTVLGEAQWAPTQPSEASGVQEGSVPLPASLASPLLDTDFDCGSSGVPHKWLCLLR